MDVTKPPVKRAPEPHVGEAKPGLASRVILRDFKAG